MFRKSKSKSHLCSSFLFRGKGWNRHLYRAVHILLREIPVMTQMNCTLKVPTFHHEDKEREKYIFGWLLRNGDLCHRALKIHEMAPVLALSSLFFFHHHSNTKNNSCCSHDDKKLVKWNKNNIIPNDSKIRCDRKFEFNFGNPRIHILERKDVKP